MFYMAEPLYRFVLIVISDKSTILLCNSADLSISTYSRACTIQTIDTAQADVSDAKRLGSSLAIIILMASFVSFPVSFNASISPHFYVDSRFICFV